MSVFTIPLTSLPVGTQHFGPFAIPNADSRVVLVIDRTVAGGLNATPAAQLAISVEQSNDGGVTWQFIAGAGGIPGGTVIDKNGSTMTATDLTTVFGAGTSREARAAVTVSGATVAVAGTVTTQ